MNVFFSEAIMQVVGVVAAWGSDFLKLSEVKTDACGSPTRLFLQIGPAERELNVLLSADSDVDRVQTRIGLWRLSVCSRWTTDEYLLVEVAWGIALGSSHAIYLRAKLHKDGTVEWPEGEPTVVKHVFEQLLAKGQ